MRRALVGLVTAALVILPLGPASAAGGDDVCAVVEDLLGYGWCESED